jgi:hypothetical protein
MTDPPPPPSVPPPRRRYADPSATKSRPRRDTQVWATHVAPAAFGFFVGLTWLTWTGGALPVYTPLLTAFGVWAITQVAVRVSAAIASRYLGLTGDTLSARREYSAAQALVAQGRYEEAAGAWEIAAAESGGDPEPYLALARLYRDQLNRPEDAAAWFRRARRDATLPPGHDLLVSQELIELYRAKLGQPQRAIPELARICERFRGTPNAVAAERELAVLREELGRERGIDE